MTMGGWTDQTRVTKYDEVENVFWKPRSGDRFRG
jgi:hypothetical protein